MQLAFATVDEAFRYCRDMDASLDERLETFANAARALIRQCVHQPAQRARQYLHQERSRYAIF